MTDALREVMPKRAFVPNVVDVTAAATCPRIALLKLVYGASGDYNAGLAIGTVTHSVLAELGRIESKITEKIDQTARLHKSLTRSMIYGLRKLRPRLTSHGESSPTLKSALKRGVTLFWRNSGGFHNISLLR